MHPIKSYLSILNPKVLYLLYLKCSISKSIVTDKETQNSPVTDCSISIAVSLLLESDCSISMPIKFYGDLRLRVCVLPSVIDCSISMYVDRLESQIVLFPFSCDTFTCNNVVSPNMLPFYSASCTSSQLCRGSRWYD